MSVRISIEMRRQLLSGEDHWETQFQRGLPEYLSSEGPVIIEVLPDGQIQVWDSHTGTPQDQVRFLRGVSMAQALLIAALSIALFLS